MIRLNEVTDYLDQMLDINDFTSDRSNNGLQIKGGDEVRKIVFAVDISAPLIERAIALKADMIFVHHGISWGDSLKYLTGNNYDRISALIKNDISLYAAHLPLDAHPEFGHNAVIAKMLGLQNTVPAFNYCGKDIGFAGELDEPVQISALAEKVNDDLNSLIAEYSDGEPANEKPYVCNCGNEVKSIGIVSGGGGFTALADSARMKLDCLVTGEFNHGMYFYAMECGVSVIAAGHYRTEVPGLIAVMEMLTKDLKVKAKLINLPTGL